LPRSVNPAESPSPRESPRLRPWQFRLIAVVILPAAFFLGIEGLLRAAGYGRPAGFFVPDNRADSVRTNPDFTSLFLPASFDLRPLNYRVTRDKPANTVRIVVLGESAAQGIPAPAFAFVPQLRALLRARHPDKAVEVINTGVVAINSHVVREIARDAARLSPDLFVVYLGNNEVVGPYGPGCSYLSTMPPLAVIRASVWARSTRTGQLLGALAGRLGAAGKPHAREWGGMAMFMDHAVRGDDPRLETVGRNFEANLRDIIQIADDAGAKTLVCTVVSNLKDSPPFLSLHRADLGEADREKWRDAFAAGKLAWKLNEPEAARARLEEAWRLDPQYAETAFMLGSLEWQAGHRDRARGYFIQAQHWDALRFRPLPRINEIARNVARENANVTLVDAARELGSDPLSTGDIAGRELMLEHVHPDWAGNHRIARLMAEGVEQALFSGTAGGPGWLDAELTAEAVGYTPAERFGLLQRAALITRQAPFPNQLTYAEDQAREAREMAAAERIRRDPAALQRARRVVDIATAHDPGNAELAKLAVELADDLNDLDGALGHVRRSQTLQPGNFALLADEAIKLGRLGRFAEARQLLLDTAAKCNPRDLDKLTPAIADFHLRTKTLAEGRRWFEEAMERQPQSLALRFYRGRLAEAARDATTARADYGHVLREQPANEAALEALVMLSRAQGRTREADDLCVDHVDAQPDNQVNHLRAAQIHEARGQPAEALIALRAAVRSGPAPLPVHLRLANGYYSQGRPGEALDQLATTWRLSLDEDREAAASIRELIGRVRAEAGTK